MYIAAYDIGDNKERAKVIRVVEQFCVRVQKSVWMCDLSQGRRERLLNRLEALGLQTGVVDVWEIRGEGKRRGSEPPLPELPVCHSA